jgi:hypothetical protein
VRDFWTVDGIEDGLLFGGNVGRESLFDVPLMAMVAERRGRSCLMTMTTASRSCSQHAMPHTVAYAVQ